MQSFHSTVSRSAGWVLMGFLLLLFSGCAGDGTSNDDGDPPAKSGDLGVETLDDTVALEAYLKDQFARSVNAAVAGANGLPEAGGDGGRPADDSAADTADFSQTNLQEAGVDEADVVKIDGNYLYLATDAGFEVVAIAGEMQVVASGAVGGPVNGLFRYGDKLVVLYRVQTSGQPMPEIDLPMDGRLFGMPYWIPVESELGVAIFDVSDPASPLALRTVEFDGHLVSSRRIAGRLHLVQQFRPELPPLIHWYDGSQTDLDAAVAANRAAIAEMALDELIPHYREIGETAPDALDRPLVAAENFYSPVSRDGGGTITTVVTFDLDDPDLAFNSAGIVADAHIVYASPENLYTATHRYRHGADLSEEATIYQFDLTADRVRYVGSGVVPGWILNQFSLGEYAGVLRVATTIGHANGWGETSRNQVYCLQLTDGALTIVGKVEHLAPGEQIYAARFMGPRGYLVTFVKIDPLFTLDLSDPADPRVVGELKVPGYSDYIHPLGDDYLMTVGKDAELVVEDDMAWYQGVQLSIFDVSDFAAPQLKHQLILGDRGTETQAAHDHKAFTFWPERDLLALPVELYEHPAPPEQPWEYGVHRFSGLYVYRVSAQSGFEYLGRIRTRSEGGLWAGPWTRGVFRAQEVYAVTSDAVRRASVADIETSVETLLLDSAAP